MTSKNTCKDCGYRNAYEMLCHRYPPHPHHGFPKTQDEDWCAEFKQAAPQVVEKPVVQPTPPPPPPPQMGIQPPFKWVPDNLVQPKTKAPVPTAKAKPKTKAKSRHK